MQEHKGLTQKDIFGRERSKWQKCHFHKGFLSKIFSKSSEDI